MARSKECVVRKIKMESPQLGSVEHIAQLTAEYRRMGYSAVIAEQIATRIASRYAHLTCSTIVWKPASRMTSASSNSSLSEPTSPYGTPLNFD